MTDKKIQDNFSRNLGNYLEIVRNKLINRHPFICHIQTKIGTRYVKVEVLILGLQRNELKTHSFVDMYSGNILKPESKLYPSYIIRGNIRSTNEINDALDSDGWIRKYK